MDKLFIELENFHFHCQQTMYFSSIKSFDGGMALLSDTITDTNWNFITRIFCNTEEELLQIVNCGENILAQYDRKLSMLLTPSCQISDKVVEFINKNYNKGLVLAWMVKEDLSNNKEPVFPRGFKIRIIDKENDRELFIRTFLESKQTFRAGEPFGKLPDYYGTALRNSFERSSVYDIDYYMAFLDNQPVGIGTLHSNGPLAAVYGVGMFSTLRGKGFGTLFMNKMMLDIYKKGVKKMFLMTAKDSYVEKWYEALGYRTLFTTTYYTK